MQVVCGVGRADKPLKHQATVPQTLESGLRQWGLKDEAQVEAIHAQIKQKAEAAMKAFMDMEAGLTAEQRGGRRAQTDVIGELCWLLITDAVHKILWGSAVALH